jgi:hypothetical protein
MGGKAMMTIGMVFVILIIITVIMPFMPGVFDAVHDARTGVDVVSANVTTGAGDNDATVTLVNPLYLDSLAYIDSITSNVTGDSPVATSYNTATQVLTVAGLQVSSGHLLTVQHEYDQTAEFTGTGDTLAMAPVVLILGIIGILIVIVVKPWMS